MEAQRQHHVLEVERRPDVGDRASRIRPAATLTVFPTPPEPQVVGRARSSRLALGANLLTLAVLWASHASLADRIEENPASMHDMQERMQAAESEVRGVRSTIDQHWREMNELRLGEVYRTVGVIDLGRTSAQYVGRGFGVTRLTLEPLSTGVLIEGLMINMQSVKHSSPSYRITVGDQTEEFELGEIEAGQSSAFSVYIPDVGSEPNRYARIDFLESTVWYREGS